MPPDELASDTRLAELAAYDERLMCGGSMSDDPGSASASDRRVLRMQRLMDRLHQAAGIAPDASHQPTHRSLDATTLPGDLTQTLGDLPDRVGRFAVRGVLGQGGCGVVMLAYDDALRREVALKLPTAGTLLQPDLRERFVREACSAAALDHPHILPVYEVSSQGLLTCIVSAVCHGPNLAEWLREQREPFPVRTAAWLVATLARAVQHAHGRGILHRDLKPSNVLLEPLDANASSPPDAEGFAFQPRITDFGLAKALGEGQGQETRSSVVMGTASYMAPEQARGAAKHVGPTCDVYSLGTVLYELLVGRPPLVGDSEVETLQLVANVDPVPPRQLRPSIPRDLETICLKCLQKETHKRFGTAEQLAEELDRFLKGVPIKARRTSRMERVWRWCRRNPAVASLTSAVALLLLVGITTITIQWRIADHHWHRSQANFEMAWQAVEEMLNKVGMERLMGEPQLVSVRRELLEEALAFYQRFIEQYPEDERVMSELARAHVRLGSMYKWLGDIPRAERELATGVQMLEELLVETPGDPVLRLSLADASLQQAHMKARLDDLEQADRLYRKAIGTYESLQQTPKMIGQIALARSWHATLREQIGTRAEALELHRQVVAESRKAVAMDAKPRGLRFNLARHIRMLADRSNPQEALSMFGESLEIVERLIQEQPLPDYLQLESAVHNGMGIMLDRMQRYQQALSHFQKSVQILEQLHRNCPEIPVYQADLGSTYANLGNGYAYLNQTSQARVALEQSIEVLEDLVRRHADVPAYALSLANTANTYGMMAHRTGDLQTAEAMYQRAFEVRAELTQKFPGIHTYRREMAGTLNNIAHIRLQKDQPQEALDLWRRAVTEQRQVLAMDPTDTVSRNYLYNHLLGQASAHRQLQQYGGVLECNELAIEAARRWHSDHPDVRHYAQLLNSAQYYVARLHLHCPDPSYHDPQRAIELLEDAVRRSPNFRNYWTYLGIGYYRDGQIEAAQEALEWSCLLSPAEETWRQQAVLAGIYWHYGQQDDARAALDQARRHCYEFDDPEAIYLAEAEAQINW